MKGRLVLALLISLAVSYVQMAWAWTTPAAGSFAYDVYNLGVVNMLQGPIGYVAAVAGLIIGAVAMLGGRIMWAIPTFLASGLMWAAPSIVQSMGAII
ncbi:MAG: hypothetical protein D6710_07885 [Nitrospirae bacterium]|nr:MAG: hypothetical protein D6710_07885 [Nitrospirota bacterium]